MLFIACSLNTREEEPQKIGHHLLQNHIFHLKTDHFNSTDENNYQNQLNRKPTFLTYKVNKINRLSGKPITYVHYLKTIIQIPNCMPSGLNCNKNDYIRRIKVNVNVIHFHARISYSTEAK